MLSLSPVKDSVKHGESLLPISDTSGHDGIFPLSRFTNKEWKQTGNGMCVNRGRANAQMNHWFSGGVCLQTV